MDAVPESELIVYEAVKKGVLRIDEEGRIWRGARRAENGARTRGYLQVRVMVGGRRYHVSAHRLVWLHVHGESAPAALEINHLNGIKHDNRPTNLVLVTASENIKHAHRIGLIDQRGQKNPAAKLTDNQVAAIRTAYATGDYTQPALAEMYGVSFQCISKIVRGARRASNLGPTANYVGRRNHNKTGRDAKGRFTPEDLRVRQFPERTVPA